jgi:hypothetical protein
MLPALALFLNFAAFLGLAALGSSLGSTPVHAGREIGLAASPAAPLVISITPVPLDHADPAAVHVGALRYRGGLALRCDDDRFGGLSALHVSPDGDRFDAISDRGYLVSGRLRWDAEGNIAALAEATIAAIAGLDSRPLSGEGWRDAEAMAVLPKGRTSRDGGTVIGFEHHHRLWLYPTDGRPPVPLAAPDELQRAPDNGGAEAITRIGRDTLLILTESLETTGGVVGWLGRPGQWSRLTYAINGGFKPTDATLLPDGDVLVIERRFPPVGARLRRIAAASIQPGATLEGEELARLEGSFSVDNMEGISAWRGPHGETRIAVVSDDNYNPFQQTLLLMFELVDRSWRKTQ